MKDILKHVFDKSSLGYAYHKLKYDRRKNIVDFSFSKVNTTFESLLQLNKDHVEGKKWMDVVNDESLSVLKCLYLNIKPEKKEQEHIVYCHELERTFRLLVFPIENDYFLSEISLLNDNNIVMDKNFESEKDDGNNTIARLEKLLYHSEERFKAFFDKAPLGYQSLDTDGNIIDINEKWLDIFGYEKEEVVGRWFGHFMSEENAERFKKRFPIFKKRGHITSEFEMLRKDGKKRFISFDGRVGRDKDNNFLQTHCIMKDITEQQLLENELAQNRELMKSVMENTTDAIYVKDTSGKYLLFNKAAERVVGKTAEEVIGNDDTAIFPLAEARVVMKGDQKVLKECKPLTYEEVATDNDGVFRTFLSTKGPVFDKYGQLIGLFGIARDITDRIKWESALLESEEKYRLIAENVADIISVYNFSQNRFTYISPSIETIRDISLEKALEEKFEDIVLEDERAAFKDELMSSVRKFVDNPKGNNLFIKEFMQPCKNGACTWIEMSTKFQYNLHGEIEAVNISRNIEERKKAEEMMIRLSYNDYLTGLYNRRYYEEKLIEIDLQDNLPISLIMVDVNGLKLTNDAFGHDAGDLLLRTIANIIKDACTENELVSRIGGDEFVIILTNASIEKTKDLISKINSTVESTKLDNIYLSLSIGYALKTESNMSMDDVFKSAEDDMYRHKLAENLSLRSRAIDLIMNSLFEKSNREMMHSNRVSVICKDIATAMGFNNEDINQLKIAGLVHDIGKIGTSNAILDKNGALTLEEWEEIKKHSETGYRILSSVSEFSEIAQYVLCHQEKVDGTGYPQGLSGEDIPIQSRIIAIADAFDAMTSDRMYRVGMDEDAAIRELKLNAGIQFDEQIAKVFVEKVLKKKW